MLSAELDLQLLTKSGKSRIVGIDEAGRGAWAGPVAIGYYVIDYSTSLIPNVADSKELAKSIREQSHYALEDEYSGVFFGSVGQINSEGIGKTITEAIQWIVKTLDDGNTFFIIDGRFAVDFGPNSVKEIKADGNYYSVAAASILAKVRRDQLMHEFHDHYSIYGFNSHVGYGTKHHRQQISEHGICPIHRTSFSPLASTPIARLYTMY